MLQSQNRLNEACGATLAGTQRQGERKIEPNAALSTCAIHSTPITPLGSSKIPLKANKVIYYITMKDAIVKEFTSSRASVTGFPDAVRGPNGTQGGFCRTGDWDLQQPSIMGLIMRLNAVLRRMLKASQADVGSGRWPCFAGRITVRKRFYLPIRPASCPGGASFLLWFSDRN